MNISVVGLGKVGSAMVGVFASKGFKVWGFDVSNQTVDSLKNYKPIIPEKGVSELLKKYQDNITFTESIQECVKNTDISFIIVPTPSDKQGFFDTTYVESAIQLIIQSNLPTKKHVIVISSTIMPGSMKRMASKFLESTRTNYEHNNIQFVYSPEFIALGNVVDNLLKPQFCLIGSDARILDSNNWGAELAIDIKTKVTSNSRPIHSVTFESAEIAKISCNTFLTTKITYANLIQQIVEKVPGAKSIEVFSVLHSDDRIGSKFFSPGLGYGGPCLPRDNQALGGLLDSFSISSQIPYATHDFNESLVESIMANKNLNNLTDRDTVLILGLAYKTGTSSTIESHSLKIAANLASKGIKVRAHDFQVDFSSTELNFLEYTSNKLDKELIGKSVIVILAQYDQMYRDFVINQIDKDIDCIDPWNMLTNVR